MAKENRIFVSKIRDGNDHLLFHIYNSTTGIYKGTYLDLGKVSTVPIVDFERWEKLKSECVEQLKRHLKEIVGDRRFKDVEYKVVYSSIFETSGRFSYHESFHIRGSICFDMLRHVNPMEPDDIRLFQTAFNSIN